MSNMSFSGEGKTEIPWLLVFSQVHLSTVSERSWIILVSSSEIQKYFNSTIILCDSHGQDAILDAKTCKK